MSSFQVSQQRYQAIMDRRAGRLAQVEGAVERKRIDTFAVVTIGSGSLGIPLSRLREIVKTPLVTDLPGAPPHVPGIVHVRGALLAVVDIAKLLDVESSQGGNLAVVEEGQRSVGLLIGEVIGFRDVFDGDIAETLGDASRGGRPLKGTTKDDLLALLDVERLLQDPRIVVSAGSPLHTH